MSKYDLVQLRDLINSVDNRMLDLIKERAEYVKMVGELKNKDNSFIYVPEREKQILERLKELNKEKGIEIPEDALVTIFTEIISACRNLEKPLSVSYLGPKESYTNYAAVKKFGTSASFIPKGSIDEVFYSVDKNETDYGVVPIENSTGGAVNYTLDIFIDSQLKIVAEVELPISHSLLSIEDNAADIKRIYSHPQSFSQCKQWITSNFKNIELVEVSSNSHAAKLASAEKNSAAIASKNAGLHYKLNVLFEGIEDFSHNTTRFLVIGKNVNKPSCTKEKNTTDKTTIMFSLKEEIGALYNALSLFYKNDVNLTMIESRPNKKSPWQYIFFVDVVGHFEDDNLGKAIVGIREISSDFKILGSYPRNS